MSDPKHLIEEANEFEAELLRAGRKDALSKRSALLISAALGVAPPAAAATSSLGLVAKAAAVKGAIAIAGIGGAGVLAVWAGVNLFTGDVVVANPKPQLETREPAPAGIVRSVEPIEATEAEVMEPAPQKATARSAPAPTSAEVDTLPRELEMIDRARSALARKEPSTALSLLDEYSARFPKPHLRAESTLLRIEALIAAGQGDAAVRLGKQLLAREPNSPYARRVRSLLEKAGAPSAR